MRYRHLVEDDEESSGQLILVVGPQDIEGAEDVDVSAFGH